MSKHIEIMGEIQELFRAFELTIAEEYSRGAMDSDTFEYLITEYHALWIALKELVSVPLQYQVYWNKAEQYINDCLLHPDVGHVVIRFPTGSEGNRIAHINIEPDA